MDKYESIDQQRNVKGFMIMVVIAQVLGLAAVVLVAVWGGVYRGGFAWTEEPKKEFNYHPLFMVIGMVFLFGDAMLVYRVFRNDRKLYIKILHAALNVFALIFTIVGLKAAFDSHNLENPPIANMYSLHSWVGLTTVVFFGLQWAAGFISFLWPGVSNNLRGTYKPVHVYMGIVIYALAIATCLMGLTEKALFSVPDYNKHGKEGFLVNAIGLILAACGIVVGYILTNPEYARQPLPDERPIALSE